MKKFLVVGAASALAFVVLGGAEIAKGPTGLVVKSGQAFAADVAVRSAPAPAPAPVGKGKAPIIGKGKGKAPVMTRG
jgi:hypothetical protein